MRATAKRVYFVSLGCPKNRVDTEVMLGQVQGDGFQIVDRAEDAHAIVVNTCGFIESAKEESIDTILEMAQYKQGECDTLVVTGCLSQRHSAELATDIPEIDHLLGSADFNEISRVLRGESNSTAFVSATPTHIYDHRSPRLRVGPNHSAYVKIAEGCDRPCSFCIIPKLRGPQRSRPIDSITREVEALVAGGVREVNLIAQDLTRYGADLDAPRPTLAALLRSLGQTGVDWIRLHYTYPTAFSDELIEVIATEPAVCNYIDVPLQHIDDELLKRMRRGHSARVSRELVARLRTQIEHVVLRTTFIVGHPGETDDAFRRLQEFVSEVEFERVGVFTYSREPGTVSAMLPERVDPELAESRRAALMETQQSISRAKHEAMVGVDIKVLVDGLADESELLLQGRWYGQAPEIDGCVYLTNGTASPGDLVTARVVTAADYDLAASLSG